MNHQWSDPFLAEPESSRARNASFGRLAGDLAKHRTNVAFIACPANAEAFAINSDRRNFMRAVRNAIEAGADIINISFQLVRPQSATNLDAKFFQELTSFFDAEWVSSAGQPAYSSRIAGAVMSFFPN